MRISVTIELEGWPITYSTFDALDCRPTISKKDDVDVFVSSHVLLATNVVFSPSFEKHTTGIGSQMLRKMGYTRGGLEKNGNGIFFCITFEMKTSRIGLGYDVIVASLSSRGLGECKKVLFIAGGVYIKLMEEKPIVDFVEHINELDVSNMPELENAIVDDIIANM